MNSADLVRRVVLTEMVTLYRAPSQVQNAEQGAVFQTAIIESLAGFSPTQDELTTMWERFKRTWTKTVWPTPGELCKALASQRKPEVDYVPPPVVDRSTTPQIEAEFRDCMRRLRETPDQFFGVEALLKMGEKIEQRGW